MGGKPLLWHVMRWYAAWGHTDFVLCLGHRAQAVVDWFLTEAGDVLTEPAGGGHHAVRVLSGELAGWRVVFADTGVAASVGMRLRAVRELVDDDVFLANYADTFCDVPLDEHVALARRSGATATFLAVRPNHSFHVVLADAEGWVDEVVPAVKSEQWINGGFFVLRPELFDVLGAGEELVEEPFARLAAARRLLAHRYEGFWVPLDTVKDRHLLQDMWARGDRPWAVWDRPATVAVAP